MGLDKKIINEHRQVLKYSKLDAPEGFKTDQDMKVPTPPLQVAAPEGAVFVDLVAPEDIKCGREASLFDAINNRVSYRRFAKDPLSLEELSFLLWSTQGIREIKEHHGKTSFRTVPSGGARHPFETYLVVNNVTGVEAGLYRYLAVEHKLHFIKPMADVEPELVKKTVFQPFILRGAAIFYWAAVPYRMEWRYSIASGKVIAIEAGHISQNLYLACEGIGAGTCAIAAYNQCESDELFGLDGEDEFVVYVAPVGKKRS